MHEQPAYVCVHVYQNDRSILLVSLEEGDWQFLCGGTHDASETPRVVGIGHLVERDPSLKEILDLETDWIAERLNQNSLWERRPVSSRAGEGDKDPN